MCGFILTNKNYVNYFLKKRGPDYTNIQKINDLNIIHNLLSLTGDFTPQPFINKKLICLFNGEIYNYKKFGHFKSDGEAILSNFFKNKNFFKEIDGEFAITIFDQEKKILYLATDLFATKPLFFAKNKDSFGVSTYKSCLERLNFKSIKKINHNSFLTINIETGEMKNEEIVKLDYNNQYKNSFNDWNIAFSKAIEKRTRSKYKKFIALSSGHDSGALACELNQIGQEYGSYTIKTNEILT